MSMEKDIPTTFTINGTAYPSTDTIAMKVGPYLRFRFDRNQQQLRAPDAHPAARSNPSPSYA